MGSDPVLPLALFRSRSFSGAVGIGLVFNLVLYGVLLCLSLFLQEARHESVLATGLLLVPMSVVVGLGSLASGRLTARFGPRRPMLAGLSLAARARPRWPLPERARCRCSSPRRCCSARCWAAEKGPPIR